MIHSKQKEAGRRSRIPSRAICMYSLALLCILASCSTRRISNVAPNPATKANRPKQLYLPSKIWMVPEGNDFNDDSQEFSYKRMVTSNHIAIFWAKGFGADLSKNIDTAARLDMKQVLAECDRFYNYYVDSLGFVKKGQSLTDRYKLLILVFKGKENTAFGGGEEDKVGIAWTPITRISKVPFGALAHEIGHSLQYLLHADGAWGFSSAPEGSRGQSIFEMTAQYMLWHVYPEWMTFENYHLQTFLKQTHYAFLHEANQYNAPYVLEYWSEKHGIQFIGKLWRGAIKGEDPVTTYKRITHINQKKFNDQMHQAACKFITWDLKHAPPSAQSYANNHHTRFDPLSDGWYRISPENCPQNYGYNGIKLKTPVGGTKVQLSFKGIAGQHGFRSVHLDVAGWRYSFLAVKRNGERVYGKIHAGADAQVSFKVPDNTAHLWLIVSGAPTSSWEHINDGNIENDEQWPYQIKLNGTSLEI